MTYSKEQLDQIFAKGKEIPGKDPARYRKDACGNEIYRQSYGKESPMGWEVDHKNPKDNGGTNSMRNLQPLQSSENSSKGAKYEVRLFFYFASHPAEWLAFFALNHVISFWLHKQA